MDNKGNNARCTESFFSLASLFFWFTTATFSIIPQCSATINNAGYFDRRDRQSTTTTNRALMQMYASNGICQAIHSLLLFLVSRCFSLSVVFFLVLFLSRHFSSFSVSFCRFLSVSLTHSPLAARFARRNCLLFISGLFIQCLSRHSGACAFETCRPAETRSVCFVGGIAFFMGFVEFKIKLREWWCYFCEIALYPTTEMEKNNNNRHSLLCSRQPAASRHCQTAWKRPSGPTNGERKTKSALHVCGTNTVAFERHDGF